MFRIARTICFTSKDVLRAVNLPRSRGEQRPVSEGLQLAALALPWFVALYGHPKRSGRCFQWDGRPGFELQS